MFFIKGSTCFIVGCNHVHCLLPESVGYTFLSIALSVLFTATFLLGCVGAVSPPGSAKYFEFRMYCLSRHLFDLLVLLFSYE